MVMVMKSVQFVTMVVRLYGIDFFSLYLVQSMLINRSHIYMVMLLKHIASQANLLCTYYMLFYFFYMKKLLATCEFKSDTGEGETVATRPTVSFKVLRPSLSPIILVNILYCFTIYV